ncbi:uncharacterized protein LOC125286589 isoform X2 [Alosa alosa]|uniref:uncharacterized protein LOC125286589 isoform X2 n=1 Tax=Alosa alosa TaxID=278164 RepID=UPI0020154556|nr:uncharacterized protein LOC125286589 isoform X2 [Alosa alosa]
MFILLLILVTVTEALPPVVQHTRAADVDPVHPARIYGSYSSVKVGGTFELRCSTFGFKKLEEEIFVYLCKNGVGIERASTNIDDSIFQIKCVTKEDAGNYSCMFSKTKWHPSEVKGEGESPISIEVTDRVYPAAIAAKSIVRSGAGVDLSCSSTDALDTSVLLAYLCRNHTIIDVQMWNSQKKQAGFHLKTVQGGNTDSYSCVLSERPLAAVGLDICGMNSVFLPVYGEQNEEWPSCACSGAVMAPLYLLPSFLLLVLLLLLLWRNGVCKRKRARNNWNEFSDYHGLRRFSPQD